MFWKDSFLDARRSEWLAQVAKIQYFCNGKWYDAEIAEKSIKGDVLYIRARFENIDSATKITSIRVLDRNGDVAGEKSENLEITTSQGLLSLWEFSIYETA